MSQKTTKDCGLASLFNQKRDFERVERPLSALMIVFYNIFGKMSREFRTYLEKFYFAFRRTGEVLSLSRTSRIIL